MATWNRPWHWTDADTFTITPKVYRDLMHAICPHGYTVPWRLITGKPTPGCEHHGWTTRTAHYWTTRELTAAQLAHQPVITIGTNGTSDPTAIPTQDAA